METGLGVVSYDTGIWNWQVELHLYFAKLQLYFISKLVAEVTKCTSMG